MKDKFQIKLETYCVPNDRGHSENVHELSPEDLAKRKVVHIDIGNDKFTPEETEKCNAAEFVAKKPTPNRGPLKGEHLLIRQH